METKTCQNCSHFCRHYVLGSDHAVPTRCGHCTHSRLKRRKPDAPACAHYDPRISPPLLPNRYETIHYLTSDFLQYILSLPLPPELRE